MVSQFKFFHPFRDATGTIGPSLFAGRISVTFEGMGGAFTDEQAVEFYRLFGEELKRKGLLK